MSEEQNAPQISTPNVTMGGVQVQSTSSSTGSASRYSRFVTGIVIVFVLIAVVVGILAFTAPATFSAVVSGFWILIFALVLFFLILGVLVMVGLKEQVKQILDIFVEGTLSIVDVLDFIKLIFTFIGDLIKQTIMLLAPIFAYLLGGALYYGLMYLYKWVGKDYDVTFFTIGLSAALIVATSFLNSKAKDEGSATLSWGRELQLKFKDYFGDALEVVLFVFFLTIDSTKLPFLPKELNVELHAQFQDYNLMVKGWTIDAHLRTTFNLVMTAVGLEVIRFIIRIVAAGTAFYKEINAYVGESNDQMSGAAQVKWALRQSFQVHRDDTIRFITYTTFIVAVFLAFPRLKLLAMAAASLSSIVMDIAMPQRMVIKKGKDLFSKIITFLFGV